MSNHARPAFSRRSGEPLHSAPRCAVCDGTEPTGRWYRLSGPSLDGHHTVKDLEVCSPRCLGRLDQDVIEATVAAWNAPVPVPA